MKQNSDILFFFMVSHNAFHDSLINKNVVRGQIPSIKRNG